ncbi:MAG: (S)-benzoin forming benzil reductase [Bacillota bacterium]
MNYIIITGASRGLGEAFAQNFMKSGNHIFCIARTKNIELINLAKEMNVGLDYLAYDLTQANQVHFMMKEISSKINMNEAQSLLLINNAGTVTPITTIEKCKSEEIIHNVTLNLVTPMILVSEFIKHFGQWKIEKRIINISSGAGKKPYFGWSCYCTSKAGLDMFTKCVAVEQETKEYPVKIISVAPGVIDTNMQKEIRSTAPEDFMQVERFIEMKEKGRLFAPEYVANKIINVVFNESIENGAVIDIGDYI